MNLLHNILGFFRGYNKPITIYKKVGNNIIQTKDKGKGTRSKFKTRKLLLYNENVSLPYPPSEAIKEGKIIIYSPSKDKYAFCKEVLDLDKVVEKERNIEITLKSGKKKKIKEKVLMSQLKITTLDSDIVFWLENEIFNAFNKYKTSSSLLAQYIPYIMVGVFLFIFTICLAVGWYQIVKPALEVAKDFTTMAVTCDVSGMAHLTNVGNMSAPLI